MNLRVESHLYASPWAIVPEMLLTIRNVYAARRGGQGVDIAMAEDKLGRKMENERREPEVVDGVAILALDGVLARRMNLMMQISGGTSTQIAARELQELLDDPEVRAVVLAVSSPGGTVDGTQSLADLVREGAKRKPLVTWASGIMASAGYWIGSAASEVYIEETTTQVGSIGVVAMHQDVSGAETRQGVKTTEITAGRYKRAASPHAPLSEEGRQTLQEQVDYTYSLFVEAVAANRRTSTQRVLDVMAEGRMFLGDQAIRAGLVDGRASLQQVIGMLRG